MGKILKLVPLLRVFLGSVFIFSALTKLIDLDSFSNSIRSFELLNDSAADTVSIILPIIELSLGILLVLNKKTYLISQFAVILLLVFTSVIITKIYEDAEIGCGCFGSLDSNNINSLTVFRNFLFIMSGIIITAFYQTSGKNINAKKFLKEYLLNNLKTSVKIFIFIFLIILTFAFSIQNRQLKDRLSILAIDTDILQPGDEAKTIAVYDMDGNQLAFEFNKHKQEKTLLLSIICEL